MGIPIAGPTYIYEENMSFIYNKSWPEFTFNKISNYICYHAMHEAIYMGEEVTTYFRSENNLYYICTKVMPGGANQDNFTRQVIYYTPWTEWVPMYQGLMAPMTSYLPQINGNFMILLSESLI